MLETGPMRRVACTTIDIKDLKRIKREALDWGMTLKELVNRAVEEYLKKHPRGFGGRKRGLVF